ncbi:sulfotransferase family protein [cyanobiont of Ornithocercus magnificus]|nr:sulfotransferase family protein [cyanobiont of Ornithocercus magnificus]
MTSDAYRNTEGTFLLGLGTQKAGTSWLHKQLSHRTDSDFGFMKEYHIFDVLTVPKMWYLRPGLLSGPRSWYRRYFLADPWQYIAFFSSRLQQPKIYLTGDMTPSYSMLSAETLHWIADSFKCFGIAVRPIFLMRDPIERIISSQRMQLRKVGLRDPNAEIAALRKLAFERPERITIRSDYHHTLKVLQQTFEPQHCFISLYESLFQQDSYKQLCRVLGVPYRQPEWKHKVNASITSTVIPESILEALGAWQRPNFYSARQYLPEIDLDRLWATSSRWCSS